jgi:hypothetical protein
MVGLHFLNIGERASVIEQIHLSDDAGVVRLDSLVRKHPEGLVNFKLDNVASKSELLEERCCS